MYFWMPSLAAAQLFPPELHYIIIRSLGIEFVLGLDFVRVWGFCLFVYFLIFPFYNQVSTVW